MHIVLIDRSRVVHKSVGALLKEAGHTVAFFIDSSEALAYVTTEETVACVLTSLEVDPIGGLELCWQLRLFADARRPLSILVMSATHGTRSFGEVLDSGADDFLSKPPSRDELHARLRAAERLLSLQRALIQQADRDHMTRLLNRGAFMRQAEEIMGRLGSGGTLTAVLIDIDHFKSINDRYGHATGDKVICSVAGVLRETGTVAARLGGEEFVLLMEGHGPGAAAVTAHRVRNRCAGLKVPEPTGAPVSFTVSLGVAAWNSGEGIDALLRRADVALYAAKTGGRNRVAMDGELDSLAYVS